MDFLPFICILILVLLQANLSLRPQRIMGLIIPGLLVVYVIVSISLKNPVTIQLSLAGLAMTLIIYAVAKFAIYMNKKRSNNSNKK